ncbi:MAG: hypothetical protein VR70_15660 [Rhodospirillaceae bacterium BRH_c57]|nr:MAG: hypothetical protein VR70_15660 [Rhodospirillaceae bacterium BRH_c57]
MDPKDDPYLTWMRFAIPGWLASRNIDLMQRCITDLPGDDLPIVEIGSFSGLSTNVLRHLLRANERSNPVISVDPWTFEGASEGTIGTSTITFAEYRRFVMESFMRNTRFFSGDALPFHVETNADSFFAQWRAKADVTDLFGATRRLGGPIAMAYIDGEHSYEASRRDFENVDAALTVGGYIIFDDSADTTDWGCRQTAQEVAALSRYQVIDRQFNYCVRKIA